MMKFCQSKSVHWCGKTVFVFFCSISHMHNPYQFVYLLRTFCLPPFCSHCVIICISERGAQQDAQLHSPNSLLSAAYSRTRSSPSLSKSSMSFSCNYENMSNLFHVPHPQATTNNDCELKQTSEYMCLFLGGKLISILLKILDQLESHTVDLSSTTLFTNTGTTDRAQDRDVSAAS